jgi:predicted AAA+ superfamily ATPase
MIRRSLTISKESSFFLFGARGTGKSTFLKGQFDAGQALWIDLLNPETEEIYARSPQTLAREIEALSRAGKAPDWVIIDEVQKIPALLDIAHSVIESHRQKFALTGSSARKLKRGHANLLGGRASIYALFPFTASELGEGFDLDSALNWGTLPRIHAITSDASRLDALRSYTQVYLKEEILIEQLVRNVTPFRGFLEVSAQMSGERLNYLKIAREIGVDSKTIQTYFDILEDTYLGFRLCAFHRSVRKSQLIQPKFYWFDGGVQRFLSGQAHSRLTPRTSAYGDAFEAWVINEIYRLNHYLGWDAKLSYLQTKNGPEIDLILSRGKESVAIEIKSSERADPLDARRLEELATDLPGIKRMLLISRDPKTQSMGRVDAMNWQEALTTLARDPFSK